MSKKFGAVSRSKVSGDTPRFAWITAALPQGIAKRGVTHAMPVPQVLEVRTFQAREYCGQRRLIKRWLARPAL
jgi:hypothetical protein